MFTGQVINLIIDNFRRKIKKTLLVCWPVMLIMFLSIMNVITITIVILELVPFSVTGLITVRENETYVFYGLVFNFYWM